MKIDPSLSLIIKDARSNFVYFHHVKRVLARLERLYEYQCIHEEAEHLMLIGESGVGKSTLLSNYTRKHPVIEHQELTEIPVLYVPLGQAPSPKTMASTMLLALGDPKWNLGKEVDLTARLVFLIKTCRVRVVIVDEVNHLVDRGGEKTLHTSADWLKRLVDATRVSFVLSGIPRSKRVLATNDQLRGRFREVVEIERFSVATRSAEHEFRSVLNVFKGYLRDLPTVDISSEVMARLFAFATDGRLRDVRRLLVRAVELAYAQPHPKLTVGVLADAFRTAIYPGCPNNRNPFHKQFNNMPLVKGDEPFAPVER